MGLKTRWVEAGLFTSFSAGRRGRRTNSPPQLGHLPLNTVSAQVAQNVHSKVQIRASIESGGKSLLQHSQLGLNSSMVIPLYWQQHFAKSHIAGHRDTRRLLRHHHATSLHSASLLFA